jgi:hypothetical protein
MLAIKPIVVYRYHEDNPVSSPDLVPEYKPPPSKETFEDALTSKRQDYSSLGIGNRQL